MKHLVRARAAVPDHAAADLRAEEEVGAEVDHLEGLLHRVRPVALDLERLARLELRLARREPPRLRRHRVRVLREGARRREHEPRVDVGGDLPVATGVVHVQRLARAAEVGQQEARPAVHRLRRADPLAVEEAEGVGRALGTEGHEERSVHRDVDLALLVRQYLCHGRRGDTSLGESLVRWVRRVRRRFAQPRKCVGEGVNAIASLRLRSSRVTNRRASASSPRPRRRRRRHQLRRGLSSSSSAPRVLLSASRILTIMSHASCLELLRSRVCGPRASVRRCDAARVIRRRLQILHARAAAQPPLGRDHVPRAGDQRPRGRRGGRRGAARPGDVAARRPGRRSARQRLEDSRAAPRRLEARRRAIVRHASTTRSSLRSRRAPPPSSATLATTAFRSTLRA